MQRFVDKVVLVTGATSGIGRSVALAFAAEGATVIASGRNEKRGQEVVEAANAAGGKCEFHAADIANEADVKTLIKAIITKHKRLDAGVNTSGVNPHNLLTDAIGSDFDMIFNVNTKGVFYCLKHQMRAMRDTGGAIVNIGSLAGARALSGKGLYGASKAAANMLVRAAALEGGPMSITVNEVSPGTIDTPMLRETWSRDGADMEAGLAKISALVPLKRLGQSDEIASAVLFLCSREAQYISGASLAVDGGMVLSI